MLRDMLREQMRAYMKGYVHGYVDAYKDGFEDGMVFANWLAQQKQRESRPKQLAYRDGELMLC